MSKTDYVVSRLQHDIRDGKITPGQPLKQGELARRYGVSPTPVREALRILESNGVITYTPHRGATVTDLDERSKSDLYLVRAAVESLATRLAVERMDETVLAGIETIHKQLAAPAMRSQGEASALLNREFHFAIYRAGSRLVAEYVETLWQHFPMQVTSWSTPNVATSFIQHHATILAAIVQGDADKAARLMSEHLLAAAQLRDN